LLQLSLVMPQEMGHLCMQVQEVTVWTEEEDIQAEDGMEEEDIGIGRGYSSTENDTSGFEYSSHVSKRD
jgi:hypothetical protein